MIKFLKNLFRKKEVKPVIEQYMHKDDIMVCINRDEGIIKIETPSDKNLTRDEIIEICKEYYDNDAE